MSSRTWRPATPATLVAAAALALAGCAADATPTPTGGDPSVAVQQGAPDTVEAVQSYYANVLLNASYATFRDLDEALPSTQRGTTGIRVDGVVIAHAVDAQPAGAYVQDVVGGVVSQAAVDWDSPTAGWREFTVTFETSEVLDRRPNSDFGSTFAVRVSMAPGVSASTLLDAMGGGEDVLLFLYVPGSNGSWDAAYGADTVWEIQGIGTMAWRVDGRGKPSYLFGPGDNPFIPDMPGSIGEIRSAIARHATE